MTALVRDRVRAAAAGRVITLSSGGVYTAPLTVAGLEMSAESHRGVSAVCTPEAEPGRAERVLARSDPGRRGGLSRPAPGMGRYTRHRRGPAALPPAAAAAVAHTAAGCGHPGLAGRGACRGGQHREVLAGPRGASHAPARRQRASDDGDARRAPCDWCVASNPPCPVAVPPHDGAAANGTTDARGRAREVLPPGVRCDFRRAHA